MKIKLLFAAVAVMAFLAGVFASPMLSAVEAQPQSTRFVRVGSDGPFRVWRDTRTNQCFIVTEPYYAMLSVGTC